jgi:catechol 2,3-dioxygenase-like lactoylglutathione lyase family enzyme
MKRFAIAFAILACCVASASDPPKRPRIFGIEHVQIFSSDISAARSFYSKMLDQPRNCKWCEELPRSNFLVTWNQGIGLSNVPSPAPSNFIDEIDFDTESIADLRQYLAVNKITSSKPNRPEDTYLRVTDPEGHRIGFWQRSETPALKQGQKQSLAILFPSRLRIIHAGFVVHDRAATDHFYKDILGFRPYWHGGMKDDQTDWVSMQVPDGTDWLEFMVNVSSDADQRVRGIMNHIAIGVTDIHDTEKRLRAAGAPVNEEPKIGRDGKWQLNLYDPDDTRVEFMEFTPTQKPCCSEYTGPHPGSKQ